MMTEGVRNTVPTVMGERLQRKYPFSSVHHNIVAAQYGTIRAWDLYSISKSSKNFVQRLKKYKVLDGHSGCVNTVAWNDRGSLLLTGSDDYLLNIYDTASAKLVHSVESGHRTNVFSAKFLPCTSDLKIVSCSGDGMLQYNELGTTYGNNYFNCHSGTTYEVLVTPGDPNTFLSCGEDGTVRLFDLRTKTKCHCQECAEDILIDARHAVTSFSVNPMLPYHLAIGCKDSMVRVFDRRTLGTSANTRTVNRNRGWMAGLFCKFRPSNMKQDSSRRVTSLQYSNDGSDILVSYCTDYIYQFTVKDGSGKVMGAEGGNRKNGCRVNRAVNDDESNSSSDDLPPVKRLRLRGDWSDTGPQARPEADEEVTPENNLMQRMSELFSRWIEDAMSSTLRRASTSSDDESSVESPQTQLQQHSRVSVQNRAIRRERNNNSNIPTSSLSSNSSSTTDVGSGSSNNIQQREEATAGDLAIDLTEMNTGMIDASNNAEVTRNVERNIDDENNITSSNNGANVVSVSPENGRALNEHPCSSNSDEVNRNMEHNVDERTPLLVNSTAAEKTTDERQASVSRRFDDRTLRNEENGANSVTSENSETRIVDTAITNPPSEAHFENTAIEMEDQRTFENARDILENESLSRGASNMEVSEPSDTERASHPPTTSRPSARPPSNERYSAEFRQRVQSAYTPANRYATERQFAASKIQSFIRLHRSRDSQQRNTDCSNKPENVYLPQYRMIYKGHRNARTMIKEANFWGEDYVLSGSDCGRVFIWDRHTGELVMLLEGDRHVVNCVQPHPFDPILATSGIDHDVKLWAPLLQEPPDLSNINEIIGRNEKMLEESRDTITVPAAFVLRMFASLGNIRRNRRRNQEMTEEEEDDG